METFYAKRLKVYQKHKTNINAKKLAYSLTNNMSNVFEPFSRNYDNTNFDYDDSRFGYNNNNNSRDHSRNYNFCRTK